MRIVNLPTVAVDTTAGGTEILSSNAARIAMTEGMVKLAINPSVEIVLICADGNDVSSAIPGAVVGTVANSPMTCPANTNTEIDHRSGPVRAISTAGTSTVKVCVIEAP